MDQRLPDEAALVTPLTLRAQVMITAHELGLVDRINCVRTVAAATKPHAELMKDNPLSKIPTLVLDDGTVIFDSPVICEYLDRLHDKPKLFPASLPERMTALRRQALGDGFLDFLLLWRNEQEREHPSQVHLASYTERRRTTLLALDRRLRHSPAPHSPSAMSRSAVPSPISTSALPPTTGAAASLALRPGMRLLRATLGARDRADRRSLMCHETRATMLARLLGDIEAFVEGRPFHNAAATA